MTLGASDVKTKLQIGTWEVSAQQEESDVHNMSLYKLHILEWLNPCTAVEQFQ